MRIYGFAINGVMFRQSSNDYLPIWIVETQERQPANLRRSPR